MKQAGGGSLDDVARRRWDVLVVGAGPAGASAARRLGLAGHTVLLVDRSPFPRWKVCGACLDARSLNALREVGLGDLPARAGAVELHRFQVAGYGRRATLSVPTGAALSRATFDQALVDAAVDAGVRFLPGINAELLRESGAQRRDRRCALLRSDGRTDAVEARIVVAAVGLGGRFLTCEPWFRAPAGAGSRMGAGAVVDEAPAYYGFGAIHMAVARSGYVGLVRVEDGRLNVAAALDRTVVRRAGGPGAAAEAILADAGLPAVPNLAGRSWRGTPPLTRRATRWADERVFVVGDAAGYVEPFTGEGITWALDSGIASAPIASMAVEGWDSRIAGRWNRRCRATTGRRQRACRVIAALLRSPALVKAAIGLLAWRPSLADPLVARLHAPALRIAAP